MLSTTKENQKKKPFFVGSSTSRTTLGFIVLEHFWLLHCPEPGQFVVKIYEQISQSLEQGAKFSLISENIEFKIWAMIQIRVCLFVCLCLYYYCYCYYYYYYCLIQNNLPLQTIFFFPGKTPFIFSLVCWSLWLCTTKNVCLH